MGSEMCIRDRSTIVTRLLHSSGQWIEGETAVRAKDDSAQAMGSAITYARRYGLAAMVGVYQTDDDAEAAQGRHSEPQKRDFSPHPDTSAVPSDTVASYVAAFRLAKTDESVFTVHLDLNSQGQETYSAVWKVLPAGERSAIKAAIDRQKTLKGKF